MRRKPTISINPYPIRYPKRPPITEPIEHIKAYLNDLAGIDMASAISNISGGIGKNEDSVNASINNAQTPYGVCAQCRTQSYSLLRMCQFLSIMTKNTHSLTAAVNLINGTLNGSPFIVLEKTKPRSLSSSSYFRGIRLFTSCLILEINSSIFPLPAIKTKVLSPR